MRRLLHLHRARARENTTGIITGSSPDRHRFIWASTSSSLHHLSSLNSITAPPFTTPYSSSCCPCNKTEQNGKEAKLKSERRNKEEKRIRDHHGVNAEERRRESRRKEEAARTGQEKERPRSGLEEKKETKINRREERRDRSPATSKAQIDFSPPSPCPVAAASPQT
jgi:hypothetical protein